MQILIFIMVLTILSCGQKKSNKTTVQDDTVETSSPDTLTTRPGIDSLQSYTTPGEAAVNEALKIKFGNKWLVLNDKKANWMKDEFDYFIVPERKRDPDYPYIAKGDFNADGKADLAALVTDSMNSTTRIAIILGEGNIVFWKEDVQGGAIARMPKSDIDGIEGGKVKMKSDGINVEFFEKSSYVIYWNGSSFKNTWTSD